METRQGKIEEKFLKFASNKAHYATFVIDGFKYNTFDKEIIDNHNPDDFVEMTGEMKGKFWTMATMKKIDEPVLLQSADAQAKDFDKALRGNGAKEYHLSPEEVKCRALECSLQVQKQVSTERILALADKFVEWIRNGN